jgi:hypothetical protein
MKSISLAVLIWLVGGGAISTGEEVIILGIHKTEILSEMRSQQ